MQGVVLLVLTLSAEPVKEAPTRAEILVRHPLYQKQPGPETDCVGILRKDKGAYFLELQTGREPLVLFPDAGDPLAPFVGKRLRVFGKQVISRSGLSLVHHTLPGRLEVLAEKDEPEDVAPPDRTRQEEDLGRIEEEIRKRQEESKRKEGNPDKKNGSP